MKRKELKNLATKIAKAEKRRQEATSEDEKYQAEVEIMNLSGRVMNLNDMMELDDLIQEMIEKNS